MIINTITRINATEAAKHEFSNEDLTVIDGKFHVFLNGVFYTSSDCLNPALLSNNQNAYVVPKNVVNDPETIEHKLFADIMRLATVQDLAKHGKKMKANKPGHVYINASGVVFLYLGNIKLMNIDTLNGMAGHAYIALNGADYQLMASPDIHKFIGDNLKIVDNTLYSTFTWFNIFVNKNPKTVAIDAGYFGEAEQLNVTGDFEDIQFLNGQISISNYTSEEYCKSYNKPKQQYLFTIVKQ
jgi:hypothetical protein